VGIKLFKKTDLEKAMMFVGWPGIGNIGIIAVNALKDTLRGEN
jgi:proteasome assembly chaperone (PAC2) family protein